MFSGSVAVQPLLHDAPVHAPNTRAILAASVAIGVLAMFGNSS